MKKIPSDVQEYIDVLKKYTENIELKSFHIIHMYAGDLAFPDGYYDSRFFNLIGYNIKTMEFRNLGKHDGLHLFDDVKVNIVRIFADGSTLIKFSDAVEIGFTQEANIYKVK